MTVNKMIGGIAMKIIGTYINGNVKTTIFDDGTKMRITDDNEFVSAFAENIDIKITNYCNNNCPYCHEGSNCQGQHGALGVEFINTLHPYQEVALGGGDVTSHPDLIPFLKKLKDMKVIANITVNQNHFMLKQDLIKKLVDEELIKGIGVSLENPSNTFIDMVKQYPNAVIHVINGVVTKEQLLFLADNDLKLLILGYKDLRRGIEYKEYKKDTISERQEWMYDNVRSLMNRFKVVSFDNLAIEQLNIKRFLSQNEWEKFYMGDDGDFTFYIDMVEQKFAKNSTAPFDERYDLLDNVDDMFKAVRRTKEEI